jgi:hypothetical protein
MDQRTSTDQKWTARKVIVPYLPEMRAQSITEDEIAIDGHGRIAPNLFQIHKRVQVDLLFRGYGWPSPEELMDGIQFVRYHYGFIDVNDINLIADFPRTGATFMGVRIT